MQTAKTIARYLSLLLVSVLICSNKTLAQKKTEKIPAQLKQMVGEFSKAIKKKDVRSATSMSRFPLRNTVYMDQPKKSQAEFEASVKEGLPGYCYRESDLKIDENGKDWFLDCDGNIFFFGQTAGKWKYLGYENINE